MSTRATAACRTLDTAERTARLLRRTFRRQEEAVVCELGLNGDDSAYELRVSPALNPAGLSIELFDDAMPAFERHAAIERIFVEVGRCSKRSSRSRLFALPERRITAFSRA